MNSIVRHVAQILGFKSDEELEKLYKQTAWHFEQKTKAQVTTYLCQVIDGFRWDQRCICVKLLMGSDGISAVFLSSYRCVQMGSALYLCQVIDGFRWDQRCICVKLSMGSDGISAVFVSSY